MNYAIKKITVLKPYCSEVSVSNCLCMFASKQNLKRTDIRRTLAVLD